MTTHPSGGTAPPAARDPNGALTPGGHRLRSQRQADRPGSPAAAARYLEGPVKRTLDIGLASAALLCGAPLLLGIALAVMLSGGKPLFAGPRLGRGGQTFRCYKFRTMAVDAEARLRDVLGRDAAAAAEWNAERKLRNDPRVTRVGAWLRATSLDELPQFWNVLRGDMSVVGARPIAPDETDIYGPGIRDYVRYRPALTGLWQVSGRSDLGFSHQSGFDAQYFATASLRTDLRLLLRTAGVVFRRRGAW